MRRDGSVIVDGALRPVRIEKRFVFRPRSIDVYYQVTNLGETDLSATFGVEINISLAARTVEHGRLFQLEENRKKEFGSDAVEIDGVRGPPGAGRAQRGFRHAFVGEILPLLERSRGDAVRRGPEGIPIALLHAALGI